jgi:hypothetical protein
VTFKPKTWYPIAVGISAVNLIAVGFAVQPGEPWHAAIHAALALAFGVWAQRLRQATPPADLQPSLDTLELEIGRLREEVAELHERMDFTERVLAQVQESRRVGPEH